MAVFGISVSLILVVVSCTILSVTQGGAPSLSSTNVPVLLWGSKIESSERLQSVGPSVHRKIFEEDILQHSFSNSPIVIFLQPALSLEDFTQHTDSFPYLKTVYDHQPSTMMASVETPGDVFDSMKNSTRQHFEVDDDNIEDLKDEQLDSNVAIYVDLAHFGSALSRAEQLKKMDSHMEVVMSKLSKLLPSEFTVFYTARKNSWTKTEEDKKFTDLDGGHRSKRQAAAEAGAKTEGLFLDITTKEKLAPECVLYIYLQGASIKATITEKDQPNKEIAGDLNLADFSNLKAACARDTANVTFTNVGSANISGGVTIKMNFLTVRREWYLQGLSVELQGKSYELETQRVWAPIPFSYHCGKDTFTLKAKESVKEQSTNKDRVALQLRELQIQAWGRNTTSFGEAYDCVGFFTIGIWMAIVVILMLVAILAFGITMLMSINTMDRFDDPKGRTITVNTTD